jgi:hypothetical protein
MIFWNYSHCVIDLPRKEEQKKKEWKEEQRERQRGQEAYETQRAREGQKKPRKYPKGKILGAFCLILVIFGAYGAWQYTQPSTAPPSINPTNPLQTPYEFAMNDVDGTTFSLASFRGRVVVIHIMAVGCHGQINPINENQLEQLKTVCNSFCGHEPVTFVTVAVATCPSSDLEQIRTTYGVTWPLGNDYDDGTMDIAQKYASKGDGTIVLIDKTFHIINSYTWITASTLSSKISQLL